MSYNLTTNLPYVTDKRAAGNGRRVAANTAHTYYTHTEKTASIDYHSLGYLKKENHNTSIILCRSALGSYQKQNKTGIIGDTMHKLLVQVEVGTYTCRCHRLSQAVTGCHRLSQAVTGCHKLSQAVTGCHRLTQDVTGWHRVSPGVTGCHRLSQGVTRCHRLSQKETYNSGKQLGVMLSLLVQLLCLPQVSLDF